MKVIHGTWIPQAETEFLQSGAFYLWVEAAPLRKTAKKSNVHPGQLAKAELAGFLVSELGLAETAYNKMSDRISPKYFILPTANNFPLPSLELSRYLEDEPPEEWDFQSWQVDCFEVAEFTNSRKVSNVIKLLNDIHFLAVHNLADVQIGSDLLFWHHYTQTFKEIIFKDQYIPALKYREVTTPAKGKRKPSAIQQFYTGWEILSEKYESDIRRYIDSMPLACAAGSETASTSVEFYDKETLLRHFSECLLDRIVSDTPLTSLVAKKLDGSFITACFSASNSAAKADLSPDICKQWLGWKQKINGAQTDAQFHLCFKLQEASARDIDNWQIQFLAASKKDPSLQLVLSDYWTLNPKGRKNAHANFGSEFEKDLLLNLGYAARMYPKLWKGLETDKPVGVRLTLEEAFAFLKESAWILEDAGYKVIVPAWWTPEGRRRAKIRLQASARKLQSGKKASKGYFSFDTIIQYQYQLSIGGQPVTEQEWQQLVNAKVPLVQFRGQWIELDPKKMQEMLEFWQSKGKETGEISLLELMQKSSESEDELEVEHDETLAEMMAKLRDSSQLAVIENPPKLQGSLRDYQKRGVSWLQYLEQLGLNGCLADDMGLGKTVQVIARLVNEKEEAEKPLPTLLIAPTSVIGNWQKEIERFAPHLQAMVHHGSKRIKDEKEFKAASLKHDIVITSYTLVRKDEKLLKAANWQRVVLDEAQNIKNPQAAQTKAILKLQAKYRLALTGTPVENRLLDLWSIFNFLNPGYLGKEPQFRKSFEIPIQKENNPIQSATLKKLVEPFILRRVKTDKAIIKDLPDKVEHKQYCNLTKEQASLYEVVVKEVEGQIEGAEGIQRKGLILSTLLKLKQICNHPAQFLQDGSDFSPERSHKLQRLSEMIEEVMAEGESLLVFTQFAEIGGALEKYLKQTLHYNTYYIHGGTPRPKREKMIAEFQDAETEPSVFILSIKAGGVGITLTKANHVFHFDRWWNPAVEDQATDRAFRIGQKKNVFVHKFLALGTLEERIDQMIEDKKKLSAAIVGADESWLTELDNESFKKLIALNKNAILE